jgi:hypothetical protein
VLSVPASRVRHRSGTFDRRPNTPLTGPGLRLFLFERHRRRFLEKWASVVPDLAPPPVDPSPEAIRAAVQEALPRTRARADRILAGEWEAPAGLEQAERPYSGIPEPVLAEDDGSFRAAPEVEERLDAVGREVLGDYCRWLSEREGELAGELTEARRMLDQRLGEIRQLQAHVEGLQRRHDELAGHLNGIVNSRLWRMRALAGRAAGRLRRR